MTVKSGEGETNLRVAATNERRPGRIQARRPEARNNGNPIVTRAAPASKVRKSAASADGPEATAPARKPARGRLKTVSGGEPAPSASDTLLNAALDLFAEQNYSTVTIKDIARATGFNPSLIYYYFGSKEELFLQAVEMTVAVAFEKFDRIRDQARTPDAVISSWIEIHVTEFVLLQKLAKVSLDYATTRSRNERIDKAIRQFYDKESVVLGQAIREGVDSGIFKPTKPRQMAVFISTFLDGALFRNMMFPEFNYRTAIRNMRAIILDHLRVEGD